MKKFLIAIATVLMLTIVPVNAEEELPKVTDHEKIVINMFRGHGCSACYSALTNLIALDGKYDDYIEIRTYEVWNNKGNSALLNDLMKEFKVPEEDQGIPFFVIGKEYFVGYNEEAIFDKVFELYKDKKYSDYVSKKIKNGDYKLTTMTLEEAATEDGIIGNNKKEEVKEAGKYDTYIIIGIFALVIGGFAALVITGNKKN